MNWPLWNFIVAITGLLILPAAYFVWKNIIMEFRKNDLAHLNQQLQSLQDGQTRIEQKLDQHLEWHSQKNYR